MSKTKLLLLSLMLLFVFSAPLFAATPFSAEVLSVTDGDTFTIQSGTTTVELQLAGIRAPERMHPSRFVDEKANLAWQRLQQLIHKKNVNITEIALADSLHAAARVILTQGEENINLLMIKEGLAVVEETMGLTPEFLNTLKQAEIAAKQQKIGIFSDDGTMEYLWRGNQSGAPLIVFPMSGDTWGVKWGRFVKLNLAKTEFPTLLTTMQAKLNGTAAEPKDNLTTAQPEGWIEDPVYSEDDLTVISYKDVDDYIGMVTRVRGKIVSTKNTGKAIYLNFDENWKKYLTVVFFANDLPDFEDKPEEFYLNKTIIVTGRVKQYHGKPEIVISSGEQIELVKE